MARLAVAVILATFLVTFPKSQLVETSTASTQLYSFSTHTFDTCGASGRSGPNVNTCATTYQNAGAAWATSTNFRQGEYSGFQQWRVPATGKYELEVVGASGGRHLYAANLGTGSFEPKGAKVVVEVELTAGDWVQFVVGQRGEDTRKGSLSATFASIDNAGPGGGGASWVFFDKDDSEPLVVAGGGGGGTKNDYSGSDANFNSTSGNSAQGQDNAGSAGNGGRTNANVGGSYWAGGGSGWKTSGTGGNNATNYASAPGTRGAEGGIPPKLGSTGGLRHNDGNDEGGDGGFGGGGGGGSDNMGTGGGGGYSGGGGGNSGPENAGGGGGGSYWGPSTTLKTSSLAPSAGHGYVKVTLVAGAPDQLVISTSGPFTVGNFDANGTWVTSTPSGTARVSVSAVLNQLASGAAIMEAKAGSVTVESDVISSFGNNLTLKATTEVVIKSAVEVDVGTADLTLWSDAADTSNSLGQITLNTGSTLKSDGGDITLGGGSNPLSDYATGRFGVTLDGATIQTPSGTVNIRGLSVGTQTFSIGVRLRNGSLIEAGAANINGYGSAGTSTSRSQGVQVDSSEISLSASLTLTGDAGAASTGDDHWGLQIENSTISAVSANVTGIGGDSSGATPYGIKLANSVIDTKGSSLNLVGEAGANGTGQVAGIYSSGVNRIGENSSLPFVEARGKSGGTAGYQHEGDVIGSPSNTAGVILKFNALSSSAQALTVDTSGHLQVQEVTGGFRTQFATSMIDLARTVGDYTIGPDSGAFGVKVDTPISISGSLSIQAESLTLVNSISSTSDIFFKMRNRIVTSNNTTIESQGGDVVLWADADANNTGRISIEANNSILSNGGDIWLAGGAAENNRPAGFATRESVGPKGGVEFGSNYLVESSGGNIVVRGRSLQPSSGGVASGVYFESNGIIDAGAGRVSVSGQLAPGAHTQESGAIWFQLDNSGPDRNQHTIRSSNTNANSVVLNGDGSADTAGGSRGIGVKGTHNKGGHFGLSIESAGGVQIFGTGGSGASVALPGQNFYGEGLNLSSTLISSSATISLQATKAFQDAEDVWGIKFDESPSQGVGSRLQASTDVVLRSDSITFSNVAISAPGSIILEPLASSFVSSGSTLPLVTNGLAQVPQSLRIGKSGNSGGVSLPANLEVANEIKIFAGKVESTADISTSDLVISSTDQISLTGDVGFDRLEAASSKAGLTSGDIVVGSTRSYLVADLDSSFVGSYGVPKVLEFLPLPSSATEDTAFELAARVGKDAYGFPMQALNRTPASFAIAKAAGSGTLAGTLNANVLGADVQTFSDLVLSDVPNAGSSTSFTISGTDLTSTTSGLLHFFNLPSGDATLSSLGVGSGALTPNFGSATRSYQVTVPNGTTSITFTPTASNSDHQQIRIIYSGGSPTVTSGQVSAALNLTLGRNTFDIEVVAENGSTSSYEVVVFRQLDKEVDWDYGNVSITQPDGSVSTASAFTDMYGASRTSALSDDVTLDEDGLPQKTITLKVGEVLHLPMTSNHGNTMGYGGISGAENHVCKIEGFTKNFGSQSGHYTIRALKAGACNGVFVTVHQRNTMVMLSLGARGIDLGSTYYRTPFVNIVVERKEQTQAAIYNGNSANTSTAVWNVPQTLEISSTERAALGNKSYTHISGPCTVTTQPLVIAGVSYFFAATAEVIGTGAGSCVIEGAQVQDNIYNAKTWSHTITFTKATQTLAFTSNVPAEPVIGSSYSPTATSSAMLPLTLAVTTGNGTVCNISSGVVSFIATGSCTIQASAGSDSNYQAASPISQTLVVGTANQSITFNQIPDKELGDVAFRAMANASSGLAVNFTTVTSNTICTVSTAGLVTIVGEGQCSVTANQAGNSQVGAAQSVTRVFTVRPEGSSAPFITAVSYGDGSLTATLIAPSFTGGNSILDYSLFAYNASNQNVALVTGCDASATPVRCTITGLTNGQAYTLKAAARTSVGLGNLSAASRAVIPLANPQAVNALTALASSQSLTITWQPPSSLGGGDFARFDIRIRPSGGNFPGLSAPSAEISSITESSYVFTGLQSGVSYDVEVITITTQPASVMNPATLQSHTARVIQTPFTRPNAPRNLAAFQVDNAVKIAFAYPDFDGGRRVDEFRVSVNGTTVCAPTQIQVCSVPMSTLTSLLSLPFVGGIGFEQQPGSLGFLSTTTQIPISVVAVNEGGTSDPATTTYNLVTGSSTPPASSGGGVIGSITDLPIITSYSKQVLQSSGDSFSITGTNFALITEIWASNTKLSLVRSEENVIRITTPELAVGPHSLILRGSFGVVTVQDAVRVIEGRIVGESTRITRTFVDGFVGRSTYLGPTNVAKLRSFVAGLKSGTVIKCYGSIPDRASMDNIKLAFKRADRVCEFVQSLNPNIEVVRTWVWKDGNEAWDRSQVRLTLFEY